MLTDEQIEQQQALDIEAKRLMRVYLQHRNTKNFQNWQKAHEAYLDSIFTSSQQPQTYDANGTRVTIPEE